MSYITRNLNLIGTFLFLVGFAILFKVFFPVINQEIDYRLSKLNSSDTHVIIKPSQANSISDFDYQLQKTALIPKDYNFSLIVPKIGINTKVAPNIDSSDKQEYLPVLQENGAAHAQNSSLPDEAGPVFIFGHSTDSFANIRSYNAAFFLLRKLEKGDDVHVFFNKNKYDYKVVDTKVVKPEEVSLYVRNTTGNTLILQTCSPPGTTLKRLLVFADFVDK